MDEMFQRLKDSGLGCFIGNIFMGGLGYADDAVFLAPTLLSMKEMLNICDAFGKKYNVVFSRIFDLSYLLSCGRDFNLAD